jgi:hypothetical protein
LASQRLGESIPFERFGGYIEACLRLYEAAEYQRLIELGFEHRAPGQIKIRAAPEQHSGRSDSRPGGRPVHGPLCAAGQNSDDGTGRARHRLGTSSGTSLPLSPVCSFDLQDQSHTRNACLERKHGPSGSLISSKRSRFQPAEEQPGALGFCDCAPYRSYLESALVVDGTSAAVVGRRVRPRAWCVYEWRFPAAL